MPQYTHGGDVLTAQASFGGPILDFSANLNPLGMPQPVRQAAEQAMAEADHYPDPMCRALRTAIARHDEVQEEQILCGNGAADLIFRLAIALRPGRAMVTAPTFSEYEQALTCAGCAVEHYQLSQQRQFDVDEGILDAIGAELDLLFLCTPNNPTGRLIDPDLLLKIAERCRIQGIRLVLDECFLELACGGRGMAPYLERYPNLFLLRAFTKNYAMAGLRLGYALTADEALRERMGQVAQPWSVSTPAQAAGVAALECCADWPAQARAQVELLRPRLARGLEACGCTVIPGQANYLLFRAPGATDLKQRLLSRGILIRSCANYHALGEDWYRVCIRKEEENGRLLAALKEVL